MTPIPLPVRPASAEALAPYGVLIEPEEDGAPFNLLDAPLDLAQGIPRFYVMSLPARPLVIDRITRHLKVTQCLAALNGAEWMLALAPPEALDDPQAKPDLTRLAAFRFSGSQGVQLRRGTWHAGPLFEASQVDFVNLELADTNVTDHHTIRFDRPYQLTQESP